MELIDPLTVCFLAAVMTFFESLNRNYDFMMHLDFFIRIFFACVLGYLIGYERSRRYKEAGIRTHVLVCASAALFMIVSKYAFADMMGGPAADLGAIPGTGQLDPGRVASTIVCGVSFIGAGVIYKKNATVQGLTTAAGIWTTACIGMAAGAGMFLVAGFTAVLVVLIQHYMHKYTVGRDSQKAYYIKFVCCDSDCLDNMVKTWLADPRIQVMDRKMARRNDAEVEYEITFRSKTNEMFREMKDYLEKSVDVRKVRESYYE